ncbi:MAG TPA: glycosyltransferase family 4 protein [Candidatus Limnocylindria bacterium]|nr:glycosyltransferase family 4 protein [Candidatus Limnocylindria bacterium]
MRNTDVGVETKLRIALVSGPMVPIPPPGYAGTERIVAVLLDELSHRGHSVTLIGPGDSKVTCELVPSIDRALWSSGIKGDMTPYLQVTVERAWAVADRFDVIHSHLDTHSFGFARRSPTPVVHTLHGRLDLPGLPELFAEFRDIPLVAISESQRRWWPRNNWVATVHHGLPLDQAPFEPEPGDYLAFVGRVAPEKGVDEAIELARAAGMTLRMAAKVHEDAEHEMFASVVQPAIDEGVVAFEGELPTHERDRLLAGAAATLMMGAWPEPFGLVAIESMATGTPVIARRAGALTETIEHGRTGFLVDDLNEAQLAVHEALRLNRAEVRRSAARRFSVQRMVDDYEAVYRELAGAGSTAAPLDHADTIEIQAGEAAARVPSPS